MTSAPEPRLEELAEIGIDMLVLPELWTTPYCSRESFANLAEHIPGPITASMGESPGV